MNQTFIGIDPGASGGLAAITAGPFPTVNLLVMPQKIEECMRWIRSMKDPIVFIERQTPPVFYGRSKGNPGSNSKWSDGGALYGIALRMSKLYGNYQALMGMLAAAEVDHKDVRAGEWQGAVVGIQKNKSWKQSAWKNILKDKALALFTDEDYVLNRPITLKTCDALLIAEYCRRMNGPQKEIFSGPQKKAQRDALSSGDAKGGQSRL